MENESRVLALIYIAIFTVVAFVYLIRYTDKRWWKEAGHAVIFAILIYGVIIAVKTIVK